MPLLKHHPAPPLDSFVACLWWCERAAPLASVERMLPTGAAHLVFPLHDLPMTSFARPHGSEFLRWRRGVVHGPHTDYYFSGPKPAGAVVGVVLRPGAAGAILGMPASEIAGRHVTIEALWGPGAAGFQERLCDAFQPIKVFRILEQDLLARLDPPLPMHPAVAYALVRARLPRVRVDQVRREVDLSARHFIDLFHDAVGLTPGRYFRVRRFSRVLHALARGGVHDLAGLAATAGYADQSHLTREFHEHAGMTPTQYRPVDAASPHHHASGRETKRRSM